MVRLRCGRSQVIAGSAGRDNVACYVADLHQRRGPRGEGVIALSSGSGFKTEAAAAEVVDMCHSAYYGPP